MSRPGLLAIAFLVCLALAGCGGGKLFEQPDPVKQYFVLKAERPDGACGDRPAGVLSVRRMNVAPSYASRELVYRVGDESYTRDYYNLFLVQPKDQLSEILVGWISGSGLFSHVAPATSSLRPDYVLESSIFKLYGDFSVPGQAKAVLAAQFFLLKDDVGQYNVLFCNDYEEEVEFGERSPEGLVKALNKALTNMLVRLETDMAKALAAQAS